MTTAPLKQELSWTAYEGRAGSGFYGALYAGGIVRDIIYRSTRNTLESAMQCSAHVDGDIPVTWVSEGCWYPKERAA